jgi:tRNA(fMet)-specific endonuclease VapC
MRKILIDTNAYVKLLAGDKTILEEINYSDRVNMSVFVLGELYAGFKGGNKEKENLGLLRKFLDKSTVQILTATNETSEVFGIIKSELKKQGKPIPINDVWIAAHTLETGSVLITYDKHFSYIPGIRLWDIL